MTAFSVKEVIGPTRTIGIVKERQADILSGWNSYIAAEDIMDFLVGSLLFTVGLTIGFITGFVGFVLIRELVERNELLAKQPITRIEE